MRYFTDFLRCFSGVLRCSGLLINYYYISCYKLIFSFDRPIKVNPSFTFSLNDLYNTFKVKIKTSDI